MEHYKTSKLNCIKICAKKWIKVNDVSSTQYSANKNIRWKGSMLRSNLCDYSGAYIVVKRRISVTGTNNANKEIRS